VFKSIVVGEIERAGVSGHTVAVPDGSPGRPLQMAAKWHDSDLIVVGSDHRGRVGRVLAGDVTLARDLAAAAGDRLRVIVVLEPAVPGGAGLAYDREWHEHAETAQEQAQARLDDLLGELGEIASGEIGVGDPVHELSYAANELDLLVTGSRGYGPVRRVMLGSTSGKLVHQAPCPVLVLTRTAVEDEFGGAEARAQRPIAG
jgi:nucleotide-binding universal stress UspA family protein